MRKVVYFVGKNESVLETEDLGTLPAGSARVESVCSLMSTGTETICYARKFDPGTSWEQWVKYPFRPGYSMIGRVSESRSDAVAPGTLVATRRGHASAHDVPAESLYPVPDGIEPQQAAWFAPAKITFMGVKAGEVRLGSRVLIVGSGPIGQMTTRWCAAAGAETIAVVDMIEDRLAPARAGGATHTFSTPIGDAAEEIRAIYPSGGAEIVIDTTGNAQVFEAALPLTESHGTFVILGDTGSPAQQHLTGDVINRGLHVVGAHDTHSVGVWNERRIVELFFKLLKRGRINMAGMNSHTFKPEQHAEAYTLAETDRASTMGIVFDWR